MADKGKAALTGAATGAAAGAVLGPWGAAGGAVIGGALGYFGADDSSAPTYRPNTDNFQYGLGPAGSFAETEAGRYDENAWRLKGLAGDAMNREGPTQTMPTQRDYIASGGQDYLTGADADARARQIEALGGIQSQTNALNQFANQAEGPSAAQALLQQSTDQAAAQQSAMARTQRGGGGAAMRNAAFNTGGIQAQAGAQAAQLRAQESQAHRNLQLQALGAAQQGAGMSASYTGALRGGDQSFAQAQAGQANYDAQQQNAYNQFQQGQEFQMGANNLNAALTAQGQNDALATNMFNQASQYDFGRADLANSQMQSGIALEQARAAAAGIGSNNFNAAADRSLQETGMMLGAVSGATGAMGQMGGGQPASGGPQPTSDIRAKKNVRPAEVARALGGKSPSEAWDEHDAELARVNTYRAAGDDWDRYSRGTIDRSTDEFGPPRVRSGRELGMQRPGLETMRALAGGREAPVDYAFGENEPEPRVDYAFGPNEEEVTPLSGEEEDAFQDWAKKNGIRDVNDPRAHYDYRGYWEETGGAPVRYGVDHFPDTYKQHGHPTFSEESRYSRGPGDGGRWEGETFISHSFGPNEETDLRGAKPYAYEYKDPERHGEGEYVGPMAQDLEHLPGVVERGPDGMKSINTPRLTLGLTGAVSEQQSRIDAQQREIERMRQMLALGGQPGSMGYGGRY